MLEKIKQTTNYLLQKTNFKPEVGIILGTGLGGLVSEIEIEHKISYQDIPNFPVSTVEGHSGKLIFGTLAGKKIIALQGRFHYYEGYSMQEATFPVRVFKAIGIKTLIVSNAAGGINPKFEIGDIMLIDDHINLFPEHPLRGKNYDELGPRFPDMSQPYDRQLIKKVHAIAKENNIKLQQGTYAGIQGPTFETPAEYKYIRAIGADAVGMSTVPEVIVARHANIPVFAVSVITDRGVPGEIVEVSHEDVQNIANKTEPKMTLILKKLLKQI